MFTLNGGNRRDGLSQWSSKWMCRMIHLDVKEKENFHLYLHFTIKIKKLRFTIWPDTGTLTQPLQVFISCVIVEMSSGKEGVASSLVWLLSSELRGITNYFYPRW